MLYIVATPIGNLKDITYRAVEILSSVDVIACEDTRHSLKLLSAYGIKKPLVAYHKFNEREESEKIKEMLLEGKNVALISDAGMPVISDPGNLLINVLNENCLEYTVIPGATAFATALVLSGFNPSRFTFIGFLPEKSSERKKLLNTYSNLDTTLIFYCAPHDVHKTVSALFESLGNRKACAVREITKLHESVKYFNLKDGYDEEPRGEYVIIVEGAQKKETDYSELSIEEHIALYVNNGVEKKEAVKLVAKDRGVPKNEIYKHTVK